MSQSVNNCWCSCKHCKSEYDTEAGKRSVEMEYISVVSVYMLLFVKDHLASLKCNFSQGENKRNCQPFLINGFSTWPSKGISKP